MANFKQAIENLLAKEGYDRLTNHQSDSGGLTKWGISAKAYPNLDIEKLTKEQAIGIYKRDYWDRLNLDQEISQVVAECSFEAAVNMGVNSYKQIYSYIQQNLTEEEQILYQIKLALIMRYTAICNKNKSQRVFLLGWLNRVLT